MDEPGSPDRPARRVCSAQIASRAYRARYPPPMCGRIVQATSPEEIAREFGADLSVGVRESLGQMRMRLVV
jgi:hypothetical protein